MYNLNHGHIPVRKELNKPLDFYLECNYETFFWDNHVYWAKRIPEYARKFGFTHVNILGAGQMERFCHRFENYPLLSRPASEELLAEIDHVRSYLKIFKKEGMRVTCGSSGPKVPEDLFEKYPEFENIQNGLFCRFLEDMVVEYFELFPECDCYQVFLWENDFTSDSHLVFPQLYWGGKHRSMLYSSQPYYSAADMLAAVLEAYGRAAKRMGKEFSILTFSHYPWQDALLIEAIERVDSSLPIILDHKAQSGDWDLFRPVNNVLEHVNQKKASMLFDGAGEYWGQCRMPFCFPEDVQFRLQHALNYNPNLTEVGMRVMWHMGNLFENCNEINFYALMRFAKDPWVPVEEVWMDWAKERFGEKAAPAMVSALKRTYEIGKKIYYILGCWSGNHSMIPSLSYVLSHTMNFGRALYEWKPADYIYEGIYREFSERPREVTVQRVLTEKAEALALVEASIKDIRSVVEYLPAKEAENVTYQFELLHDYTMIIKDHSEAFIRYWVEKKNPTEAAPDNREKLEAAMERLEKHADYVQEKYKDEEPVLRKEHITKFLEELKKALTEL